MKRILAVAALAILLPACQTKDKREAVEALTADQVPKAAMDAAKAKLPGYNFKQFYKKKVDNQDVYEIRGSNSKGEIHEAEVSAEGKIIVVE